MNPRRAKCQQEAMAWSKNDAGVGDAGPFQKAVPFLKLSDEAAEMCECAAFYPHISAYRKHRSRDDSKSYKFQLAYGFLCSRYSIEIRRRLTDFLIRHPETGKQFIAEDAQGKR